MCERDKRRTDGRKQSLDRSRSPARPQRRHAGQLNRLRDFRRQRPCEIRRGLGQFSPTTKNNAAEIVACARARWKIENESFNVMKNHGYELEHNFGHGEAFLATTLAALNLLAFAWRPVVDLVEPPLRKAREAAEKYKSFFAYIGMLTSFAVFPDWSELLKALATFSIPPNLIQTPKIE
jgi:hypothetical protein